MTITVDREKIILPLTIAMGKVRIADFNGNHIRRPSTDGRNQEGNYAEWMITNSEIEQLIKNYLSSSDRQILKAQIEKISQFLKGSKFAVRGASKETMNEDFLGFKIYRYREEFYSFEKTLDSQARIRLTFKMGDFTLAVHMFVLLPFDGRAIRIFNKDGEVARDVYLGKGAYAVWKPSPADVISIINALACASDDHKNDLVGMLSN